MQNEEWLQYPKTRKEAKVSGAKYYFTGEACKHGHIAPRKTKGACIECVELEWKQSYSKRKEYFEQYRKSEAGKAVGRRYYAGHKDYVAKRDKARRDSPEGKQRRYEVCSAWRKKNVEYHLLDTQMYRRRIRHCTPKWLTKEEREQIREIYRKAMEMTKLTGEKYTVDHIVPLRSKVVSGLHVPWNLRVIHHVENSRKGNRLVE